MKTNQDMLEQLVTPVVECLKQRRPPWLVSETGPTPWRALDIPVKDHGRPFEGVNLLVLWAAGQLAGFRSPYWLTRLQAQKLHARCPERAGTSLILFGKGQTEACLYTVFNAEQIDSLPGRFQADSLSYIRPPAGQLARAEEFLKGLRLNVVEGPGEARYVPGAKMFRAPSPVTAADPAERLSMWMQLIPHMIGEQDSSLGWATYRPDDPKFVLSELAASLAGGLLCAHFGIPCRLRPEHLQHLPHWENFISRDPGKFRFLLKSAQACARKLTASPV